VQTSHQATRFRSRSDNLITEPNTSDLAAHNPRLHLFAAQDESCSLPNDLTFENVSRLTTKISDQLQNQRRAL
jgi:hypothetical protein